SGLAGHSLGHYLSACSQVYASSGDERFKAKVDYIIGELAACQKNRPDGYLGAMPDGDRMWAEVKRGEIRSSGFDLDGLWSPWYTNHKVLAGILDAYELAHNEEALKVAEKFADWMIAETADLTPELWQKMLGTEYGGMNDVLAQLYRDTKQEKYLDLARKFYDNKVLAPLAEGHDDLAGKHSNTQIPKIVGLANLYEVTGDSKDEKTAEFFWDQIVHHHTYAIGGNSDHEYLGPPDKLNNALSSNTCESCNTYNMLKLTRHLIEWQPSVEYADFYEKAHLNHMLASQDPDDGMVTYFMPLASGSHREYSDPDNNWTCCHGTGMETHTKHADSVYFHAGASKLYVLQFIPTDLNWRDAGVKVEQRTAFPANGLVALTVVAPKPRRFEMLIRHPGWAADAFDVKVNGKVVAHADKPGRFVSLDRTWRGGDRVEFTLPMKLRTEAMPDNPDRVALLYGPLVLAADLGPANEPAPRIPVLVTGDQPVGKWLLETAKGSDKLELQTQGVARPEQLTFRPFYAIHHDRYATYFDIFTQAQWDKAEADYRAEEARQRDLESRTVDLFRIGEMQPERDHNLKSERNDVRGANGRSFRTPLTGGWMEFEMKSNGDQPEDLVITYWGNERLRPDFEILVDGQKIAEETLAGKPVNAFYDVTYPLPEQLTKGKDKLVVRFQSTPDHTGGSLSAARIVRRK
ncbi:MAG TPA: beta-L-arabinofuranosidase domain-containing protein, partial [Fimbriimonadaceae bacterium]|nr:beta-L-arabinofuranosidase domain-containing protein [Fimbriimonadaceae bacterium]